MSIRSIACRLFQYGHNNIRKLFQKSNAIFRHKKLSSLSENCYQGQERLGSLGYRINYFQYDSFFKRCFLHQVSNSYAAQLRRKAASSLMYGGRSAFPMFAFVGLSLMSGENQKSSKEKVEEICEFIRNSMQVLPWKENPGGDPKRSCVSDYEFGDVIAKGCNAVVYAAKHASPMETDSNSAEVCPYNLAIKMMFNYEAESNSEAILRSMVRETVPALFEEKFQIKGTFRKKQLPPHLNIIEMSHAFVDYVPSLADAVSLYPDALPVRLNAHGFGRNMTLFLVMKRYQTTLREYLSCHRLSCRAALLLFTQLLEGVVHLNQYEVVHRDIKSDNILLYFSEDVECPLLVISDFGCCLADPLLGMSLPYVTDEIDKGGNGALMAPEVSRAEPGPRVVINYSKADLWASATLAYEIFGAQNPFYGTYGEHLDSKNFTMHDLPPLPEKIPHVLQQLVYNILVTDPRQRPPAEIVSTACQLLLWAPYTWYYQCPSDDEILEWLVNLSAKVICQTRRSTEYQLLSTFLSRVRVKQVAAALSLVQRYHRKCYVKTFSFCL